MTVRDANIRLTVGGLDEALSKAEKLVRTLEQAVELSGQLATSQAADALGRAIRNQRD